MVGTVGYAVEIIHPARLALQRDFAHVMLNEVKHLGSEASRREASQLFIQAETLPLPLRSAQGQGDSTLPFWASQRLRKSHCNTRHVTNASGILSL
jgi:hypothetical protein